MELEEVILPHCSSFSGVGHPVQKLTCCFQGQVIREKSRLSCYFYQQNTRIQALTLGDSVAFLSLKMYWFKRLPLSFFPC